MSLITSATNTLFYITTNNFLKGPDNPYLVGRESRVYRIEGKYRINGKYRTKKKYIECTERKYRIEGK